jgi:hypothetical protein
MVKCQCNFCWFEEESTSFLVVYLWFIVFEFRGNALATRNREFECHSRHGCGCHVVLGLSTDEESYRMFQRIRCLKINPVLGQG